MRQNARELSLSLAEFSSADYGQLCQKLGLSPSRPHANATGKDTRKRRRRRRTAQAVQSRTA
jgi:hypothetical protein